LVKGSTLLAFLAAGGQGPSRRYFFRFVFFGFSFTSMAGTAEYAEYARQYERGKREASPYSVSITLTLVGANRARSWFPVLGQYFLDPGFVPLPVSRVHASTVFPMFVFPAPRRFSWLCGDNASRSADPSKREQRHQPSFVKHVLLLLFVLSINGAGESARML